MSYLQTSLIEASKYAVLSFGSSFVLSVLQLASVGVIIRIARPAITGQRLSFFDASAASQTGILTAARRK